MRNLVLFALLSSLGFAGFCPAQGTPIGFAEEFALSTDREKTLESLIPGTEEHYYYQCLHRQHTGRFAEVGALLKAWTQRHGRTARVIETENRQALLTYSQDPNKTLALLKQRMGLSFSHQRQIKGEKPNLPMRLNPTLISVKTLTARAWKNHRRSVDGFRKSAYASVAAGRLDDTQLMSLLQKLDHPDIRNLPALVVRNLKNRRSHGFGSLRIHRLLLLEQLEECVQQRPSLINDPKFVQTYLTRLQPSSDINWQRRAEAREAYLDRLQAFASRLTTAHNSLKAHVLHHRLAHDLERGTPNMQRFRAYLRLPRNTVYVNRKSLKNRREPVVNPQQGYPTELKPIGDDHKLVRSYLIHFFASMDSYETFAESVNEDYLRRLFAETKILAGTGDKERWYSMLNDPGYYERLEQRVDIEFAATQKKWYGKDEKVAIDIDVKNVNKLLLKGFEIDAFNYIRGEGKEVDASINLDGLVANQETTHEYSELGLRRVRRHIELPSLDHSGVYVVELIGNGISSRAVIQKGRLQHVTKPGAAGHVFRVFDEQGSHLKKATIWLQNREYGSDKDGEIVIPYSTKPGRRSIVLRNGALATLHEFGHQAETYRLMAGIHVERESLLARKKAKILVRPTLSLNGLAMDPGLLEDPTLTITAVDGDGVASSQDIHNLKLSGLREFEHEIAVPANLAKIRVTLKGRIRSLSRDKTIDLVSRPMGFELSQIRATPTTSSPLLGRTPAGYVLDILGKNGEPKADYAVQLQLTHRDYTDTTHVALKSDGNGRIHLGNLKGVTAVYSSGFAGKSRQWTLTANQRSYPRSVHGITGSTLRIPYQGTATQLSRQVVALLELRGGSYAHDSFEHLTLRNGFLELDGLQAGDYRLFLKETGETIEVAVTTGTRSDTWAIGVDRALELEPRQPLHVRSAAIAGEQLLVQLANTNASARVHVVATRYLATYSSFYNLRSPISDRLRGMDIDHPLSSYHSGREIGDEYRYILDRRFAKKYPGNMLRRPGLLLNPWALDKTETAIGGEGGAGGRFRGPSTGDPSSPGPSGPSRPGGTAKDSPGTFADLEFLPRPSRILANLVPQADGSLAVPLKDLGDGQIIHILAVDVSDTVYATVVRSEQKLEPRNRALVRSLDTSKHFTEQRRIEFVDTGKQVVIGDVTTSDVATYDSLAAVYQLYRTLNQDADFAKFAFILDWPELKPEQKHELYSQNACHELHFFIHQKDRKFFDEVIRPYLVNKTNKTFLDHWFLEGDLSQYLESRAFERLNFVERILLAHRISAQGESVARHIRELFDLKPYDPESQLRYFNTALKSLALGGKDEVAGKLQALSKMMSRKETLERQLSPRAPGPSGPSTPGPAKKGKISEAKPQLKTATAADDFFMGAGKDRARRKANRRLYRAPDPTRQFIEHNYWHRRIDQCGASMIAINAFWHDFAASLGREPFFSEHLAVASSNFAEMMFALSVLDLPFKAAVHNTEADGKQLTMRAGSPLLIVRKEIQAAEAAGEEAPILVSQNYYRLDERYRYVGNERFDAYVKDEFLTDTAYACQVVVTNPTSAPRKLELLLQIPQGAIPVRNGFVTRGVNLHLAAYATSQLDYAFYFPRSGNMPHYPVHVAKRGKLIAFTAAQTLRVVVDPTKIDTTSWEHVSQSGEPAAVLRYLDDANLNRTNLDKILWRMRDRQFFAAVIDRLRQRHHYHRGLWSYAVNHNDQAAIREFMNHADSFIAQCGRYLRSPLLDIDPVERLAYQHIEYDPLINPRAHRFGKNRVILNYAFAKQYRSLLQILTYRKTLDSADWMSVTYYFLLQDRIEEALASFARVNAAELPMRIQHEYMRAYLDFFTADHALARGIAEPYLNHAARHWRLKFQDVIDHLDEAEGKTVTSKDPDSRDRQQGALAASEPALELTVEAKQVALHYRNVKTCEINYYDMDVESLFSTHPFMQQGSGSFAYIRPNFTETRALPEGKTELAFALPERYLNANVLVEVRTGGITRRQPYYANSLSVHFVEAYGQVVISHTRSQKPLSGVYAKVFARMPNGKVLFHKDGYTDLRGRFDYASISGGNTSNAVRYAVLVLSEENGAVIREVVPPKQ